MTEDLLAPTAKEINEAHRLARTSAETAVQHAIRCGKLLAAKKDELKHGTFQAWVEKHCEFSYSTCNRYMKAGQNSHAGEISAIRHLFPSGRKPKPEPRRFPPNATKGAVCVVNPKGTEETGKDRPAAPSSVAPEPEPEILSNSWEPDDDEEAILEQAEKDYAASIDKVMAADDRLATAHAEIKRQAAEIASLKVSRDGWMNGKSEAVRMLKTEQAKTRKLGKALDKANAELEKLRERIAIMETS